MFMTEHNSVNSLFRHRIIRAYLVAIWCRTSKQIDGEQLRARDPVLNETLKKMKCVHFVTRRSGPSGLLPVRIAGPLSNERVGRFAGKGTGHIFPARSLKVVAFAATAALVTGAAYDVI